MNRQHKLLLILTAVLLLVALWWTGSSMFAKKAAADSAFNRLRESREIIAKIKVLREQPAMASGQEKLQSETAALIEQATQAAGMPRGCIERITPLAKQKIEKSSYKKQTTNVVIKNVTTEQIVKMLYTLSSGPAPLRAESILLTAANINDFSDTWNAEIGLTYLIYDMQEKQES